MKWLMAFVGFDVVLLGAILASELFGQADTGTRVAGALTTFLAPPVLLLLNTIVPSSMKHMLVFWRAKDVLPGHRAFSTHVESDPRIHIARLRQRIGEFPIAPRDQQNTWFGIYQLHKTDGAVVDAHRLFLIFRDLAALSCLMALSIPLLLWAVGLGIASWATLAVFGCQYFLAAAASNHAATRFVCTVLSLESHSLAPRSP